MQKNETEFCLRLAKGIAAQFGKNCEVVVHDLGAEDKNHTIVAIENGQVSGRRIGDGPSQIVFEALRSDPEKLDDRLAYLTKTADGKILKSSTIFLRDAKGRPVGVFAINYDVTMMLALEESLHALTVTETPDREPEQITHNVADLLEELIEQSVKVVGKPAALMNKDDKIRAIRFLNDSGAFLITKSGPKVCAYFGISKYTLYSYLDEAKSSEAEV
ncbi:MAG: transcriptional regulator [Lachnospiraceae bacterium]|nr:transcriptional regulator [Lachnospiraceae bacterium]